MSCSGSAGVHELGPGLKGAPGWMVVQCPLAAGWLRSSCLADCRCPRLCWCFSTLLPALVPATLMRHHAAAVSCCWILGLFRLPPAYHLPASCPPAHLPLCPHSCPRRPAGVPRLFVGQIPTTCTEEDLVPVFAGYGEIEKVSLVRGPDNKSRGCCMVRRPNWLAARGMGRCSVLAGSSQLPLSFAGCSLHASCRHAVCTL